MKLQPLLVVTITPCYSAFLDTIYVIKAVIWWILCSLYCWASVQFWLSNIWSVQRIVKNINNRRRSTLGSSRSLCTEQFFFEYIT